MDIEKEQIRRWKNSTKNGKFKIVKPDETFFGKNYCIIEYLDGLRQLVIEEELLEKSVIVD